MAMFDEHKTEDKESEKEKHTDYTGVIIGAMTLPVLIFFDQIGKTDIGLSVTICLGMNMIAIRLRWELRKCLWFWMTIVFVFALELPLLLMIPGTHWEHMTINRITLLPIGVAVCMITSGAVKFVENFIVKYVPPDENVV